MSRALGQDIVQESHGPAISRPHALLRRLLLRFQSAAERSGKDWLIYNPYAIYQFHAFAARDSAAVARSFERAFPNAESYVDVGAGSGAYSAELRRRGHCVIACERSRLGRWMARWQHVDSRPFELANDPPADIDAAFDVAFCFEVAEHIPPEFSEPLVRFIAGLAPTIAFTAAPPGQEGIAHINLRPPSYWTSRFEEVGARHDAKATETVKTAFVGEGVLAPWLIQNIMVFRSPSAARGGNG
jgi:SAM-dependent methyltransferase